MTGEQGPLRPRVRLRVGVTGHRPGPKLPPESEPLVKAAVEQLFAELSQALAAAVGETRWAFGAEPPEMVVISALAEGADRIVAEAGLAAGAHLEVVLPQPRADYLRDFATPKSKAEFRRLLERASSVFELDADTGPLGVQRGYEAAGLVTLAQSDLLIAVWDEGEAGGIGGTAVIVEQAVSEGAPVLLINPASPREARLLWTGDIEAPPGEARIETMPRRAALPALPQVVKALVSPPRDSEDGAALHAFYREPRHTGHGWPFYSLFLWVLAVRSLRWTDFAPKPDDGRAALEWAARFPESGAGDPLTGTAREMLAPAGAVVDGLAVHYGEVYRSAFVFNFLAAAVTVTLALLGLLAEHHWFHADEFHKLAFKAVLVSFEIGLIAAILFVWLTGAKRGWHQRWLDYRRAAEWLSHLRILSLVGARIAIPRPRSARGDHRQEGRDVRVDDDDWVGWYVRSVERLLPLPNRVADADYLTRVRQAVIEAELNPQIAYNHTNSHRMHAVDHRLHWNGIFLFGAPAAVGVAYLAGFGLYVRYGLPWAEQMRFFVTGLTAALPAFGAALNAIRVQGDFDTVASRSAATAARLARLRAAIEGEPLEFARLSDRVQRAAELMSADLAEWRTLFRARPLSLPA